VAAVWCWISGTEFVWWSVSAGTMEGECKQRLWRADDGKVSLFDLCQHQNVITHLFTRAYGHLWELLLKSVFFYIYIYIGQLVHYGHLVRSKLRHNTWHYLLLCLQERRWIYDTEDDLAKTSSVVFCYQLLQLRIYKCMQFNSVLFCCLWHTRQCLS